MSILVTNLLPEQENKKLDPFDADQALTPEGTQLRKSITVSKEDLEPAKEKEEIDELLKDTMAFVTNCLPK